MRNSKSIVFLLPETSQLMLTTLATGRFVSEEKMVVVERQQLGNVDQNQPVTYRAGNKLFCHSLVNPQIHLPLIPATGHYFTSQLVF